MYCEVAKAPLICLGFFKTNCTGTTKFLTCDNLVNIYWCW